MLGSQTLLSSAGILIPVRQANRRKQHLLYKIGTEVIINNLQTAGRITGIFKDRRRFRYNVRYILSGVYQETSFRRHELTLIVPSSRTDA